jgi:hypothetical protein
LAGVDPPLIDTARGSDADQVWYKNVGDDAEVTDIPNTLQGANHSSGDIAITDTPKLMIPAYYNLDKYILANGLHQAAGVDRLNYAVIEQEFQDSVCVGIVNPKSRFNDAVEPPDKHYTVLATANWSWSWSGSIDSNLVWHGGVPTTSDNNWALQYSGSAIDKNARRSSTIVDGATWAPAT